MDPVIPDWRVGLGFDVHAFADGPGLVLGGVAIPHPRHLAGHSDGDAALHAIADALLGAMGEGDLGTRYPSSDPALAGIRSAKFIEDIRRLMDERGFAIANLDLTLIAGEPRLGPHFDSMRAVIARLLALDPSRVGVKAKTTDGLGALGRGEGIAAQAVVLLVRRGG